MVGLSISAQTSNVVLYTVSSIHASWTMTQRHLTGNKETWRLVSASEIVDRQTELLDHFNMNSWRSPVPELIRGTERIIKYGTYDREQLEPDYWYPSRGRCVLVGDVAHLRVHTWDRARIRRWKTAIIWIGCCQFSIKMMA